VKQETYTSTGNEFQPLKSNFPRWTFHLLKTALICAFQLKLLLRRARAAEPCARRRECLSRFVDGVERICASLERLVNNRHIAEPPQADSPVEADLVPAGGSQ